MNILESKLRFQTSSLEGHKVRRLYTKALFRENPLLSTEEELVLTPDQLLGAKVVCPWHIKNSGTGEIMTISDVVATITQTKTIVTTAVVGLPGTIKEHVNNGDYGIGVTFGVFGPHENTYPYNEVKKLISLLQVDKTLQVQCDFLEVFGIKDVVCKDYTVAQKTNRNYQTITANFASDPVYEIKQMKS